LECWSSERGSCIRVGQGALLAMGVLAAFAAQSELLRRRRLPIPSRLKRLPHFAAHSHLMRSAFNSPSCLLCCTSDLPLVVAPSRARRGEVARPCPLHNSSGHVVIVRISLLGEGLLKGMHSMAHCSKQSIKRMAPVNLSVGRESSSSARVASGSCESGPGSTRCPAASSCCCWMRAL